MTEEEFLTALAKTPRIWRITHTLDCIRTEDGFCPIDAVAGVKYAWVKEDANAGPLNLGRDLAIRIQEAADTVFLHEELRMKLLKACGLAT